MSEGTPLLTSRTVRARIAIAAACLLLLPAAALAKSGVVAAGARVTAATAVDQNFIHTSRIRNVSHPSNPFQSKCRGNSYPSRPR